MYISPVSIVVLSCIYQSKKCFSVDLCWFVITSGSCKSGQQPKSITDVRLGGASSGTEVATIDRGGSSPDRRGSESKDITIAMFINNIWIVHLTPIPVPSAFKGYA